MYVGEGPILPAALARHSSISCIQSSGVLPKLKFQPSYNDGQKLVNELIISQSTEFAEQKESLKNKGP